jgi:transketolase
LALSRQVLPTLRQIPEEDARLGTLRGGYIARRETAPLALILLATGSELHLAMEAAEKLGPSVRVVSLPCFERFERQTEAYREDVLPAACDRRISIEAGVTQPWFRYVGLRGKAIGIDRFGLSAPGGTVMKQLGISVDSLLQAAQAMLATR